MSTKRRYNAFTVIINIESETHLSFMVKDNSDKNQSQQHKHLGHGRTEPLCDVGLVAAKLLPLN